MHECKLLQSCPTLCSPRGCNLTGSSVHGILQARILEWVAMPFSRGSSDPGIESVSPTSPTPVGMLFTTSAIFSQASFTAAKMWKQPKCPLIDEWGKKMCTHTHTHTHTHLHNGILLSLKRILQYMTTRMNLEDVME